MKRTTKRGQRRPSKAARSKQFAKSKAIVPRTAEQFFALSEDEQDRWNRVEHVVSKMRAERVSLTDASREFGLDRKMVLRLAKSALRTQNNGRYVARKTDKLLRVLVIPTADGLGEVAVRDSRTATQIAEYSEAVRLFIQKGDESRLGEFKKKRLRDASGKQIRLVTDTRELDRLGNAGVLSFESLYARAS